MKPRRTRPEPQTDNPNQSPVNPIPPVVIVLFLMVIGVEAALSLASSGLIGGDQGIGWRLAAIEDYAFAPSVWDLVVPRGDLSLDLVKRFVTYLFVHGSFTHALFGGVMVLALGKFVGDIFRPVSLLIVFFVPAIVGAFVYGAFATRNVPLIGVYPATYGLIGAFTYIMWWRLGQAGENQLKAFRMIGFLLTLQLVYGLLFGANQSWIAEVAGFVTGLGLSVLVAPGGWRVFLRRLRRRSSARRG